MKWLRKLLGIDYREIEGRCHVCRKRLTLVVHRLDNHSIKLCMNRCPEHGYSDASILWPQTYLRPDLYEGE